MATNTVIFDQVYKILESTREILRLEYDHGNNNRIDRTIHFRLNESGKVVKCEDDDEGAVSVTVSWDNNNANLRTLAREVMHKSAARSRVLQRHRKGQRKSMQSIVK